MSLVVCSLDCNLLRQSCSVFGEPIWRSHVGLFVCNLRSTPRIHPDVCTPQTLLAAVCGCRLRKQLVFGAKVAFRWTKVKWGFLFSNWALWILFGSWSFQIYFFFRTLTNLMSESMNLGTGVFVLASWLHSRLVAISNACVCFTALHLWDIRSLQ